MIDSGNDEETKSNKNQILMKTTFYIIVTVFGLQSNLLFANGSNAQALLTERITVLTREVHNFSSGVPPVNLLYIRDLAPLIPAAASFEDDAMAVDLRSLSPENPKEADFRDSDLVPESSPVHSLAPVIPAEADFIDSDGGLIPAVLDLAPLTPKEADFTDTDINGNCGTGSLAPVVPENAEFEDHV